MAFDAYTCSRKASSLQSVEHSSEYQLRQFIKPPYRLDTVTSLEHYVRKQGNLPEHHRCGFWNGTVCHGYGPGLAEGLEDFADTAVL